MQNLYYNHITILKVIATFFITWFHFKSYAPAPFDIIFIGGMLGNSLFFLCSGYLSSIKKESFRCEWLINKWIRIMPSVWIGTILFLYFRDIEIYHFLYPTVFWFVNAILIFYIIFYIFNQFISQHKYTSICILLLFHSIYYFLFVEHTQIVMDAGGIKIWFYCFIFFLYGFYIKNKTFTYNIYSIPKCFITIIFFTDTKN